MLKFFIKLQGKNTRQCLFLWTCWLLPKIQPSVFSLKFCEVFQNIFALEHLITTTSKYLTWCKEVLICTLTHELSCLEQIEMKKTKTKMKKITYTSRVFELVFWRFQDKLVLGSCLLKFKIIEQNGVKTYICWNRLFGKFLLNKLVRLHIPYIGGTFSFSLLCGEGRVELPLPLLGLHCMKYKISHNFLVWKFCGNAQFPQFSGEFPGTL